MNYSNESAYKLKYEENKTWKELSEIYGLPIEIVRDRVRKWKKRSGVVPGIKEETISANEVIMKALTQGATIDQLKTDLSLSERIIKAYLEEIGELHNLKNFDGVYQIVKNIYPGETVTIDKDWDGSRVIKFAVVSDTHINSNDTQLTHLHHFYNLCANEGIDTFYHSGDIDEGEEMRLGHKYECYAQGADAHVDNIISSYPKIDGCKTYFITGNHDHSIIKRVGVDIGKAIARDRKDMIYLGQNAAMINLTPNCRLELRHPGDGMSYALSYKLQKMIEAMQGGEKPNILCVGHYHKSFMMPMYRNVQAFASGCFQAQTSFMRGKQLAAQMGGWIIEAVVNVDGTVERIKGEFINYYTPNKDDFKRWQG